MKKNYICPFLFDWLTFFFSVLIKHNNRDCNQKHKQTSKRDIKQSNSLHSYSSLSRNIAAKNIQMKRREPNKNIGSLNPPGETIGPIIRTAQTIFPISYKDFANPFLWLLSSRIQLILTGIKEYCQVVIKIRNGEKF